MVNSSGQRKYSSEERAVAIELAGRIGPTAAGKQLGIPMGTISCWTHLAAKRRSVSGGAPAEPTAIASTELVSPTAAPQYSPPAADQREAAKLEGRNRARPARPAAKVYTPSERARALEYAAQHGPTAASREFNISRFSLREWMRKAKQHAKGERKDNPLVGPDTDPAAVRDRRIVAEWRSHPGLGPSQVRNQLRRQGLKVSVHTVRCVLEENGYVRLSTVYQRKTSRQFLAEQAG